MCIRDREVTVITTGDDGIAQTGEHDLPFGSYSVTEVGAPAGYRLSDPETRTVEVCDDGRLCDAPTSFADLVSVSYTHLPTEQPNATERSAPCFAM